MWGVVLIHSFPIQILKLFQAMIKKRKERERERERGNHCTKNWLVFST